MPMERIRVLAAASLSMVKIARLFSRWAAIALPM
jgi:hypothetical protein